MYTWTTTAQEIISEPATKTAISTAIQLLNSLFLFARYSLNRCILPLTQIEHKIKVMTLQNCPISV